MRSLFLLLKIKGIALIQIFKTNFMLLSYDPDKISLFKILLKTIPNIYNTKFYRNNQLLINKTCIVIFGFLYYTIY